MELEIDFKKDNEPKADEKHTVPINSEVKSKLIAIFGSGKRLSQETRKFWAYAIDKWEKERQGSSEGA